MTKLKADHQKVVGILKRKKDWGYLKDIWSILCMSVFLECHLQIYQSFVLMC
jgi:hypothetical protein